MRLWPFARALPRGRDINDDLLITEDLLRRNVEDLLAVRERQVHGPIVVFRGDLLIEADRALDLLLQRFGRFGYTPFLRSENGSVVVQAWPLAQTVERQRIGLNVTLFLLTCLSTLLAGALMSGTFTGWSLGWLVSGAPFAVTLLSILGTHEFGHYFTARHYKASVSLPYFIPAPPPFLFGTLGAIIRLRSPARDRNSLFDIAAAGPLAGLLVALPAIMLGLAWSKVAPVPPGEHLAFGDSLLMRFLVYLHFGSIPAGSDVFIHPVALAGWVGLFVTALNLFPVGQLDGGRIAYALFGSRHRLVGTGTFVALIALAAVTWSANWLVWAALIFFLVGFHHSPPLDDLTPLTPGRRAVGLICFLLLVLLVPPVPISID
jgi:membrane-associated protease RseP (regulator of RpoE activity)